MNILMEKLLNTVLQIYLLMGIYLIQRFLKLNLKAVHINYGFQSDIFSNHSN